MRFAVADLQLRIIVSELARNGFPRSVTPWEADFLLSPAGHQLLAELSRLSSLERQAQNLYVAPTPSNLWWQVRLKIRQVLQDCLLKGLVVFHSMVQNAIEYGAIPDPTTGWRFYKLPDGWYACWECGSELVSTDELIGDTQVMRVYCPYCDLTSPAFGGAALFLQILSDKW